MKSNKKIALICLLLVIIIIALVSVTLVLINRENARKQAQIEPLLSVIEDCIITSQECFNDVHADSDAMNSLNAYIDNINNTADPIQKAYIAQTMVNYAKQFVDQANVSQKQKGTATVGVQGYDNIAAKMTKITSQLKTAQANLQTQ